MNSHDNNRQINGLVVGETGTGKSSVINMIFDNENLLKTSERAVGCTSECDMVECSPSNYPNLNLKMYDTIGIEESNDGTVPTQLALEKFDNLLKSINDGIHILLFCVKMGRLPLTTQTNYQLFFDTLCDKQVPCILVITHCETENLLGTWWTKNKDTVEKQLCYEITDAVSVTTIKETVRGANVTDEYYSSRKKLINSIINNASSKSWNPNINRKQFYLHLKKIFALKSNRDFIQLIQTFLEIPQQITSLYSHPRTSIQLKENILHEDKQPDIQTFLSQSPPYSPDAVAAIYSRQIEISEEKVSPPNIVILVDDYTYSPQVATNSRFWYQKITNDLSKKFLGTSIRAHMCTLKSIVKIIPQDNNDYCDLYPQPGGAVTLIFIRHQKEIHSNYSQIKKAIKRMRTSIDELNNYHQKNRRFFITTNPYAWNYPRLEDYNDLLKSLNIQILELDFSSKNLTVSTMTPIDEYKATIIYEVIQSALIKLLNKYDSINTDFK